MPTILWRTTVTVAVLVVCQTYLSNLIGAPAAADNKRLNDGGGQRLHGEETERLRHRYSDQPTAAARRAVARQRRLHNRTMDGDLGSDGSTVQDRADRAGYQGVVSQTVAINPRHSR